MRGAFGSGLRHLQQRLAGAAAVNLRFVRGDGGRVVAAGADAEVVSRRESLECACFVLRHAVFEVTRETDIQRTILTRHDVDVVPLCLHMHILTVISTGAKRSGEI